jgi:glycosyltransferase involved in cell wall biosynthesis
MSAPTVLHVRSSAGLYGAEYVVLGLIPELARLDIDSTLLSIDNHLQPDQILYERARELGVPAQRLPCRGRFDFATVRALRDAIAAAPNPLLHVHDYKSALVAWLARGRRRIPIVATSHGHFATTSSLRAYQRLELWLMRRFDEVCIVSAEMKPVLAAAGVPAHKVHLIENGIDTQRFRPDIAPLARAEFGIAPDALVFGSAMRLTEQKNPLGFVEAFAKISADLPRAVLAIAGNGELRDATLARAAQLGVGERVHLVGARNDLDRFYTMLDVFVLPSFYEGLPLALLEAMSAGRRLVATAVGEVPAVLANLPVTPIAPGNVEALAEALRAAPAQPSPFAALRERVIDRYSVARMAQAYADIYRRCGEAHARAAA